LFNDFFAQEHDSIKPAHSFHGKWIEKFSKGGNTFLHFVSIWMKYTEKLLHSAGEVPWGCIEGYGTLVKAVLGKIRETNIQDQFSLGINHTTNTLILVNERMLFPIIKTLFLKTK